jgi:16S rRNA (uracil1498-N3)-methyltransferase
MHLFYYGESNLSLAFNSGNALVSLSGDEAAHLKVLRPRRGESILLTDGMGNLCRADVEESSPKHNLLRLTDIRSFQKPPHRIHIAVAPPKNIARFEWFLEKATEAGIDEITPFFSENSERSAIRPDRLNKVVISAMKQSLKTFIPKINESTAFKSLLSQYSDAENSFIAWLDRNNEQKHLKTVCRQGKPATVLIGPEGDFSPSEVASARERGFTPVSLGSSRLRTETAALAACFIVNIINEPDVLAYPFSTD